MRINSIGISYHNFCRKKYVGNISTTQDKKLSRSEKITICALSAAAVGIGIATIAIAKKTNPIKNLNKKKEILIKNYRKKHPKQDPVVKMLKGNRNAEAINAYKAYRTKEKIASLNQKVLNNEINLDNPKIHKYIVQNKLKMERELTNLLT